MPAALDPARQYRYVLKSDAEKNPAPTFILRPLTGRMFIQLTETDAAQVAKESERFGLRRVFDFIRAGVVGWEHMNDAAGKAMAFDPAKIEDLLTPGEANELLGELIRRTNPTSDDAKK